MTFASYLFRTTEGDSYDQAINLGRYNPNYMRIEQDFVKSFDPNNTTSNEEKQINCIISSEIKLNKASFEAWEYINSYPYLKVQAKNNVMNNMRSYLWDSFLGRIILHKTSSIYGKDKANRLQALLRRKDKRALLVWIDWISGAIIAAGNTKTWFTYATFNISFSTKKLTLFIKLHSKAV